MKRKLAITAIVVPFLFLVGCADDTTANPERSTDPSQASYWFYDKDAEYWESRANCLESAIYSARQEIALALDSAESIESELYWLDETDAWYPEDHDELDDLVDEADKAFYAIDNIKSSHLDDLLSELDSAENELWHSC